MKFIFSRFLIGSIVIIIGAYILLQYVFHIYIPALAYTPVFTIIVSFLIIAWGIAMIFGRGFYASKLLLGLFVIGGGIYILIRYCFNINMPFILYTPIFRMIIGMIIIFLGAYILLGMHYVGDSVPKNKRTKYDVYFKTKTIDLSDLEIDRNRVIDINTVFSDTVIFISDKVQLHIKASSAFGSVSLPTGDSVSFGETNFVMGTYDNILYLNVNAAFAQIRVLYK
ncbi:hypothetical protein [uncultured Brachyspira sp.]|uniref:hypothetical protein n=1 Tax=uncultured Brachyspira sp. TaxID=221953 RepID=UPI002619F181|nr:hypothetical protein [uncultured Brachyspira sp.]